jgi:hypothetical protein
MMMMTVAPPVLAYAHLRAARALVSTVTARALIPQAPVVSSAVFLRAGVVAFSVLWQAVRASVEVLRAAVALVISPGSAFSAAALALAYPGTFLAASMSFYSPAVGFGQVEAAAETAATIMRVANFIFSIVFMINK